MTQMTIDFEITPMGARCSEDVNDLAKQLKPSEDGGLTPEQEKLQATVYQALENAFRTALQLRDSSQWAIGDLMLLGEGLLGERVSQLLDVRKIRPKTAQNYRSACLKFPEIEKPQHRLYRRRRREPPTFSHHMAIAALMDVAEHPDWTEAGIRLLERAATGGMSVESCEEEVRKIKKGGEESGEPGVGFQPGTLPERIETIRRKVKSLLGDLPEDWTAEAKLLDEAHDLLARAYESARNRKIGQPALLEA